MRVLVAQMTKMAQMIKINVRILGLIIIQEANYMMIVLNHLEKKFQELICGFH